MRYRRLAALSVGMGLAVLSANRFLLSEYYYLVCALFLGMFFVFFLLKESAIANAFAIMALFALVDNGGGVYNETNSILRYFTIFSVLSLFLLSIRPSIKSVILIAAFSLIYLISTTLNASYEKIDPNGFVRDLFQFLLFCLVLINSKKTGAFSEIDHELLIYCLIAFSVMELINSNWFDPENHYLSYDSTKALIVYPAIYYLNRSIGKGVLITVLIGLVLILYVTRMILLTFLIVLFLIFILKAKESLKASLSAIASVSACLFIVIAMNLSGHIDLSRIKLFGTSKSLVTQFEGLSSFERLDKVRYNETKLFIGEGWVTLLVGKGFGSGIYDQNDLLSFVSKDQTAFSAKELDTGFFVNFHDIWVDVGLRFGIIFLLVVYSQIIVGMFSRVESIRSLSMLLFVLVTCSFYSTSGLVLVALFYASLLNEKRKHNIEVLRCS